MTLPSHPYDASVSMTPQVIINHKTAIDLDPASFEGPEKLLEVWFAAAPECLPTGASIGGLKAIPSELWVTMLDMVNCKVLSVLKTHHMDAYLLSESSMFVFPHKVILKTCGTTTLLLGLQQLLQIAAEYANFPVDKHKLVVKGCKAAATPYRVFYSRKNFLFPDRQQGPHRSWLQEMQLLNKLIGGGRAYMVGRMNGDHWYLYVYSHDDASISTPHTPDLSEGRIISQTSTVIHPAIIHQQLDETLEILMTDLDPDCSKLFYETPDLAAAARELRVAQEIDRRGLQHECSSVELSQGHAMGAIVTDACGLGAIYPVSLYPNAQVDSYMFSPCGYSANGILSAEPDPSHLGDTVQGQYWTVHVTPETGFSYASFETNIPVGPSSRSTAEIIDHVISIFRPGRFSVTFFLSKPDNPSLHQTPLQRLGKQVAGYNRRDHIAHDLEDYDLVFRFYERKGFAGDKGPRMGEVATA